MAEKTFRSALTPRAWALLIPALAVAVMLIVTGVGENARFSNRDSARYLLAWGPIAFGVFLLVMVALALRLNLGRRISTSRKGLRVEKGGEELLSLRWDRLDYAERDRIVFRVLMISDGVKFLHFVDLFYADFGTLRDELYAHDRILGGGEQRDHIL